MRSIAPRRRAGILALLVLATLCVAAAPTVASSVPAPVAKPSRAASTAGHARVVAAVERLLRGIPESGDALGDPHAPVTMRVFGDLECPFCRTLALGAMPGLIEHDVRRGALRIEALALETATREPQVFLSQQVAALAAGSQGRLWYFDEIFYREQGREHTGYVTGAFLRGIARQVPGLDISRWRAALADPVLIAQVVGDEQDASKRRIDGDPSFLLGRTGGRMRVLDSPSLEDPASLEAAVAKVLRSPRQ